MDEIDLKVMSGEYYPLAQAPCVPGYQISGVVDSTGTGVRDFTKGDAVVAIVPIDCRSGGVAEFCVVDHTHAIKKPKLVSFDDAAAR